MNKDDEVAVQKLKSLYAANANEFYRRQRVLLSKAMPCGEETHFGLNSAIAICGEAYEGNPKWLCCECRGRAIERERILEILQRRQTGIVANLPVSAHTNSAYLREEFRMMWQHMINEIEATKSGE